MEIIQFCVSFLIVSTSFIINNSLSLELGDDGISNRFREQLISDFKYKDVKRKSCFCINGGQPPVTKQISSDDNNLERLVIYLYKDTNTNDLYVYIPNTEKQFLIPDLPFEENVDSLSPASTETVLDLINTSPHVIMMSKIKNIPGSYNETHADTVTIHSPTDPNKNSPLHRLTPESSSDAEQNEFPISVESDLYNIDEESETQADDQVMPDQHGLVQIISTPPEFPLESESETLETEFILHPSGGHARTRKTSVPVYPNDAYITFDRWFHDQMKRVAKNSSFKKNSLNFQTIKNLIERTLEQYGMYVANDGVLIDSKGEALDMTNLKLRPILIGNSVDFQNMKDLQNGNDQFEFPKNNPYLEAVVIALVSPPKILGIIPVGVTYIPKMDVRDESINRTKKLKCINSKCTTFGIIRQKIRKPIQGKFQSRQRYIIKNNDDVSAKLPRYFIRTLKRLESTRRASDVELSKNGENTNETSNQLSYLNPIMLLKQLEKLYKKNYENTEATKNRRIGNDNMNIIIKTKVPQYSAKLKAPVLFPYDYDEDYLSVDEGDKPDFRIIGGHAAMSSGTPVISRGRSGFIG